MGLFKSTIKKISQGLARTRGGLVTGLRTILTGKQLSEDLLKQIETQLIQADVGVKASNYLVDDLRGAWERSEIDTGDEALLFLKEQLNAYFPQENRQIQFAQTGPTVILVAGINGSGKTTSIAKMAKAIRDQNKSVILAACDTFRAAAVDQLKIWGERLDVHVIAGQQGGKPSAVAWDAADAAQARNADVLLVDTAGRLHTQKHLMEELKKIRDVLAKKIPGAPHEVILVLDATTGQNAIRQAHIFTQTIEVTGVFLAKLDGTAKGGIVVAIREELNIPVKFIGVGETPDDVEPFEPDKFVEALFAES